MDIPASIAGTITVVLLVVLGLFIYPMLLRRRGGALMVGAATVILIVLFYLFDNPTGLETGTSGLLAVILALLPLITGLVVKYSQDKGLSR